MAVSIKAVARAPHVTVAYENPLLEGRTGKVQQRSVILTVDRKGEIRLHSLVAAGKKLKLSPMRTLQLIREGQLKAHRIGRDWFVLDQDLEEFIRVRRRFGKRVPTGDLPRGEIVRAKTKDE